MTVIQAELKNVTFSYGKNKTVDDLSLAVEKGTIVCLLGPSGCGKTTTLELVGGFLRPEKGQIFLAGKDITKLPPEQRAVSTVFQSYALFPHMTVLRNVTYGLKYKGIRGKEAEETGMHYLEMVGLTEYARANVREISGGQQQRVALARALTVNPEVILMDEPLSNLDAKLRVQIREELKELQRKIGMTVIFVTHDQEEAMVLGDRIAVMNGGKIAQLGTAEEIYHHPNSAFVMDFIGKADKIALPGGETVAVRPESVRILRADGAAGGPESCAAGGPESCAAEDAETGAGIGRCAGNGSGRQIRLPGTVVKAEFLGFYRQYTVRAGENELMVRAAESLLLAPGDEVTVIIPKDEVIFRGQADI